MISIILGMVLAIVLMVPVALWSYIKGRNDQLHWVAKNGWLKRKV